MNKDISNVYNLGRIAQKGDTISMIKLVEIKRRFIKKLSYNDEDCYQYIIEILIKGINNYKF